MVATTRPSHLLHYDPYHLPLPPTVSQSFVQYYEHTCTCMLALIIHDISFANLEMMKATIWVSMCHTS